MRISDPHRSDLLQNSKHKARNKKRWKKVFLSVGIPFIVTVSIFLMMFISVASVLPSAAEGAIDGYKEAAELAGCTWQELMVYDTVRFNNELEGVDPAVSAVDFLKLHYEKWIWIETEDGGYWSLSQEGDLSTAESICGWLELSVGSTVQDVMKKAEQLKTGGDSDIKWIIQFSAKELDDLMIEKNFDEEQVEWADMLMTSGVLEEMFGDIYDLPDYIGPAGSGYFEWPVPELHTITSKFAASRKHPVLGITRAHNGVDISGANAMGSPVVAIDDGVVVQVNLHGGERGINIRVQHNVDGDVWVSRYQHLSAVNTEAGAAVKKGTVIGAVGNSGIGTGPHLHLELTYNGVLIDPLPLIQ